MALTEKDYKQIERLVSIGKQRKIHPETADLFIAIAHCTDDAYATLNYVISELENGTETPLIISELQKRIPEKNIVYRAD